MAAVWLRHIKDPVSQPRPSSQTTFDRETEDHLLRLPFIKHSQHSHAPLMHPKTSLLGFAFIPLLIYTAPIISPEAAIALPVSPDAIAPSLAEPRVPISSVSLVSFGDRTGDDRLELLIEGTRLGGCDAGLRTLQHPGDDDLSANPMIVQVEVLQLLPSDPQCMGTPTPFQLPFTVQLPASTHNVYEIRINDYYFTVERSPQ